MKYSSPLFTITSLLLSSNIVSAEGPAGNERYTHNKRATSLEPRSGSQGASHSSITFSANGGQGNKEYISPIGPLFKSHVLTNDWGVEKIAQDVLRITVFDVEGEVNCASLSRQVDAFEASDDVWDKSFLQAVVLQSTKSFHVASDLPACLEAWDGKLIVKNGNATSDVGRFGLAHVKGDPVPHGPYLAHFDGDITLTQVYRSYRDSAQAFTSGVVSTVDGSFTEMAAIVPGMNTLLIPVPSRLYTLNQTGNLPLAGKRIAVKDIYDIAGLRTGCGNRAYWETYGPRNETAVSIQRLIQQGAVIVGKVKTSSFANGESATAGKYDHNAEYSIKAKTCCSAQDWVDQMCPYNPRADGYQQPSSSSSGPGAAIAAYDWLDATIGSDTGCSILCPSAANGVYGMRPTWGAMPLQGVMPLEPLLDTAGFLCRDPEMATGFARAWYGDSLVDHYDSYPKTIHFPSASWTFTADSLTAPLYRRFRDSLTGLINPTTVNSLSDEDFWNATGRFASHNGSSVAEYLGVDYGVMIDYNQWNTFGQPWFDDYAAQNEGRRPFVSPSPETRWAYGRENVTQEMYDATVRRKQDYKDWFAQTVLFRDNQSCSNAIYVTTWTGNEATPSYRNVYGGPPSPGLFGYGIYNYAGVPQLNIPIGQVPYNSTISGQVEYLPVTVSMNAAAGCDYLLWDIAAALKSSGALQEVDTGRLAFPM